MRIIGGNLRGKKILKPIDKLTRPLKDMVRESIFNIINHSQDEFVELNNAKILDLFSGTGSFGIECLSRGAKKVTFFENYSNSIKKKKKT
jgi:N6-adenine-specific methylase